MKPSRLKGPKGDIKEVYGINDRAVAKIRRLLRQGYKLLSD